jgi:hypothetical protein
MALKSPPTKATRTIYWHTNNPYEQIHKRQSKVLTFSLLENANARRVPVLIQTFPLNSTTIGANFIRSVEQSPGILQYKWADLRKSNLQLFGGISIYLHYWHLYVLCILKAAVVSAFQKRTAPSSYFIKFDCPSRLKNLLASIGTYHIIAIIHLV